MGICEQIHDNLPDRFFLVDSGRLHDKHALSYIERERLDFAYIDTQFIIDEF